MLEKYFGFLKELFAMFERPWETSDERNTKKGFTP